MTPLPATVPAGGLAAYELTITNNGPSNISKLYLFSTGTTAVPVYVSNAACNISGPLSCSFGALNKKKSIDLIVAYQTPSESSADFTVNFEWNTTGLGSGGGDNSHGDALKKVGTTHVNPDTAHFVGGFILPGTGPTTLQTLQDFGEGNPQTSQLFVPTDGIGATLGDGEECGDGDGCFGKITSLVVGDGSTKYGPFKVIVQLYHDLVPEGVSADTLQVDHILDNGSVVHLVRCTTDGVAGPVPCFSVVGTDATSGSSEFAAIATFSGTSNDCDDDHSHHRRHHDDDDCKPPPPPPPPVAQDLTVTIWLDQNGYIKYH